jgi:dienelactone hydrolase
MWSAIRFLRHYLRAGSVPVETHETSYTRGGERVPATVFRPGRRPDRPRPGWLVLHGLTYTGREHPGLIRFARAVAATGRVVMVPDIPEWRALRVAPAITVPTIQAAIRALHDRPDIEPTRTGLLGFSFGATQALVAVADPAVARLLRGVVAWGGYHGLDALFHFGLTGEFELDGVRQRLEPDPYGCWVMSANYLTHVPGYEDHAELAAALHQLAIDAGRRRLPAWDPAYDAVKRRLRADLPAPQRRTFDTFAPLTSTPRTVTADHVALAHALARAAARTDPLLEPAAFLPRVAAATLLAHGRDDRLVPYTESLRLARALPAAGLRGVTVTALFEHSGATQHGLGPAGMAVEAARFVGVLQRMLGLID